MIQRKRFYLEWIVLNILGFAFGSLHGATTDGFVPRVIPGTAGLILGDIIFGGMVGFAQYLSFRRTGFLPASIGWIIANSLGFTLGARIGAFLTFRLTNDWIVAGIIFGVIMGGSIGLATTLELFRSGYHGSLGGWLAACIPAWIIGESIAFAFHFSMWTVPLVALAIGGISGLGLIFSRPQPHVHVETPKKEFS